MIARSSRSAAVALTLIAALFGAACSGPTSPSDNTPFPELLSGRWTLTAQQPAGQGEVASPAGATFSFEITETRVGVVADCNRCGGAAVIGDGAVTFGPALACTRAFCSTAPFDNTFVQLLTGENAATLAGDTLVLRSNRGTLRFRR